nr:unnamed protein product [Digitaria exilis]
MARRGAQLLAARGISSSPCLARRIKQTESEIVRMFYPPVRQSEEAIATVGPRYTHSVRVLDERFIRILKIFKWGPDAEKALEVLMLRVDHWLVREVMKTDVGVNVKMQFFRWAAKRRNYEHDTSTYMALIRCLEIVEQYGEMWKMIQEMVRNPICVVTPTELSEREGCRPDTIVMNNMINFLGKAGRLDDAIKLFREMGTMRCIPSVVTYNTIIKALFESKSRASEVPSWFESMKGSGISPSSFTYSILIDGFCKTNRTEKAMMLLEEMDEKGFPPCPAAYCSLIDALGKAKRYDLACELFQELKENCGSSSARVYAVMIKHLGKAGRLDDAVNMFEEMNKLGCTPDVYAYNALMSGLSRKGLLDEALTTMRRMQEHGCIPDINSYNIILNGLAKTGGPHRAMEMLSNMKQSAIRPDAVSYNTVLGALSHAGMFEEAAKLMKEMNTLGFEYDLITYSSILEAIGNVDHE